MVAIAIGKKTISAQITTRAVSPPPNQMSSSGASARIGTAWAATMYGDRTRSTRRLLASSDPDDDRRARHRRRSPSDASRPAWRPRCAPGAPEAIGPTAALERRPPAPAGCTRDSRRSTVTSFQTTRNDGQADEAAGATRLMPRHLGASAHGRSSSAWTDASASRTSAASSAARRRRASSAGRGRGRSTSTTRGDATRARRHDHDAVGERDRLAHAVGDEDHRARPLEPQALELGVERLAGQGVERAERLVEQEDRRVADERPRQRRALRHAARQLARPQRGGIGQADPRRAPRRARSRRSAARHAVQLERQRHVVERSSATAGAAAAGRRVRRDRRRRRGARPTDQTDARPSAASSPAISAQERALAASVRTDDDRERARRDRQAAARQRRRAAPPGVGEAHVDVVERRRRAPVRSVQSAIDGHPVRRVASATGHRPQRRADADRHRAAARRSARSSSPIRTVTVGPVCPGVRRGQVGRIGVVRDRCGSRAGSLLASRPPVGTFTPPRRRWIRSVGRDRGRCPRRRSTALAGQPAGRLPDHQRRDEQRRPGRPRRT